MSDLPEVTIYTDGGADPNPGPGGWGAVLVSGMQMKEISGADPATTNNRMELTAAISALGLLRKRCRIHLHTDSQYLRRGITEWVEGWRAHGWRKRNGAPVENVDLWQALLRESARHDVDWHWVRGHRGDPLNERADALATEARQALARGDHPGRPAVGQTAEEAESLPAVSVYARGCALGVPGPAGYAATVAPEDGEPRVVSGGWESATSNAMELWAAIAGLRTLRERSSVAVYTTSSYVLEGATRWLAAWERRGWRTKDGRPVKNREIWEELARVMGDHDVHWFQLTAGADVEESRMAAEAARAEAERMRDGKTATT